MIQIQTKAYEWADGWSLHESPHSSRPEQYLHDNKYLKSLDLHFLEPRLVLQVTDDRLLPADDGSVHGGLLQVLNAHLGHLQLGTHPRRPLTTWQPRVPESGVPARPSPRPIHAAPSPLRCTSTNCWIPAEDPTRGAAPSCAFSFQQAFHSVPLLPLPPALMKHQASQWTASFSIENTTKSRCGSQAHISGFQTWLPTF